MRFASRPAAATRAPVGVARIVGLGLVAFAIACHDAAAPSTVKPISEADVDAVVALNAQLASTMAAPSIVSLLGVTSPFSERAASGWRVARPLVVPGGRTRAYLGDAAINPTYLGSTFVRAGAVFRRDTSRRDAPAAAVRVLLYERAAGAATANVVGWMDMADSVRGGGQRVTTAIVGTPGAAAVASVRGSLALQPQGAFGTAVFDVLSGTVGTGAGLVAVSDSLVVDSISGDNGRAAVVMLLPAQGVALRSVQPAAPGQPAFTSRLTITVGTRTVRIEAQNTASGTSLAFFNEGLLLGTSNANSLPDLGDAARTVGGGNVPDVVRRWMNAVGRLLQLAPSASDLARSAGVYVSLLDPVIP
ncbi:MAG: hypothetical protein HY275_01245 [Gemmatimonadetes bacterium]|nr:hypothetical protein [Gemmatimonadota bacterium]